MNILFCALLFLISASAMSDTDKAFVDCSLSLDEPTQNIKLQDYLGKVVYVDFWASWCPPCLKSFPYMNQLHQQFSAQGLKIIAVNLDEQREDADHFTRETPHAFSVAFDNQNRDCAGVFGVKAMPSSYLIDKKGRIRQAFMGFKSEEVEQVTGLIMQLLAEQ